MKKIICKKEYDTETSTLIKKYTCGNLVILPVTRSACIRPRAVFTSCMYLAARLPRTPLKTFCAWQRPRLQTGPKSTDCPPTNVLLFAGRFLLAAA